MVEVVKEQNFRDYTLKMKRLTIFYEYYTVCYMIQ